jgi:hypothetical protein
MREDERAVLQAIKDALALQTLEHKSYVIRAWAQWGTPQQSYIFAQPVTMAPTLDPDVILQRAKGTIRTEIMKLGFSAAEADQVFLTFEAVEADEAPAR